MNPCPCGYRGHPTRLCKCGPDKVAHYASRISGPLLDRIDLHVTVPALKAEELDDSPRGEPSARVRERVVRARERQLARQQVANARLSGNALQDHARMEPAARGMLRDATARKGLSARANQRVLRVARTIADLDDALAVARGHVAEALLFRD
jgi:magnesium chelatase family protein